MKDVDSFPSLWVCLMGAQVRIVTGRQYVHRVIEAGSGDPLILVHGVGSSAEIFARNVMPLAEHFHVCAIDALYHGYSSLEPYDAENRVRRQAGALLELMDALGIPWAHMEGESMGAGMVFDVALRHRERCGKLIFTSGSYFVNMKRQFESGPETDLLMPLCRDSVANFSRETVLRRMEYLVVGEYLAHCLHAQYHLIRNAAHWPQWERPEEHDRVVTDFLLSRHEA